MSKECIRITKKTTRRGEDGNRVVSVRLKESILHRLDNLANVTNRSRNELMNILLDYAVDNVEIID